jgi:receptor-binding and translocation channel-forming TcA subunit of Tc toxin
MSDGSDYTRAGADDPRFSDYFGSTESIVTSTGQNDSGLFETSLHDERYLPFEGSGAISTWQLTLPTIAQFDYETIADAILHLRYTAREGGAVLAQGAVANLKSAIDNAQTVGSIRLFSLRHEFPSAWARFKNVQLGGTTTLAELALTLKAEHYPFWSQGLQIMLKQVEFFAQTTGNVTIYDKADGTGNKDALVQDKTLDLQVGSLKTIPLPAAIGTLTLYLNNNIMDDLWLIVTWGQ